MVSVPPVVSGALVSASATTAELRIAASLVPVDRHPHRGRRAIGTGHGKVSETDWPTFRLSKAEFAV